jgi:hypothetical protein
MDKFVIEFTGIKNANLTITRGNVSHFNEYMVLPPDIGKTHRQY